MRVEDLCIVHFPAKESPAPAGAFVLETCQRRLWAGTRDLVAAGGDRLHGEDAYRFLLQVASGLESQVQGETDVFGQVKDAWRRLEDSGAPQARELRGLFQNLFEDTKEIRARYLQSVGGSSYGSLVRKMLSGDSRGPVLLVGAGSLARSVAPYLAGRPLMIWNRTRSRALELAAEIRASQGGEIEALSGDEAEASAWARAAWAIVCVPADPARDARRVEGIRARVIHLGVRRGAEGAWADVPGLLVLDDLFEAERTQSGARSERIEAARRACRERARLRAMGGSITLAHGWEDLAAFA